MSKKKPNQIITAQRASRAAVTTGPCILLAMGVVVLFLLNRRVQDELEPLPNQSTQPTQADGLRG